MKIKDLLNNASGQIFVRGEDYYSNDYISFLAYNPQKHSYYGEVKGSGCTDYKLKIGLDEKNNLIFHDCNCPYDGHICKHLVAVLLAIEKGEYIESSEKNIDAVKNIVKLKIDKEDILDLMEKASKEELIEFIAKNGFKYEGFLIDLEWFLKKPDVNEEIKFLVGNIKSIISKASYFTFDNDPYYHQDETGKYVSDLENVLIKSENSLNKDRYIVPFHVSIEIIHGVNQLYDFSFENYSLEGLVYDSFQVLNDACDLIKRYGTDEEKENALKILIENSQNEFIDYDYNYNFFNGTLKFLNKSNKKEIYDAIDDIDGSEYHHEDNLIIKSKIIEITEDKEELENFKIANTQIDEFATELIEKAINNNDLKFAEQLALEKLNENKELPTQVKWEKILHNLYKSFKIINKQIEIGTNLIKKGNSEYYFILKELYKSCGLLEEKYDELISDLVENSNFNDYGPILKEEKQWELLWEGVKGHPNTIFVYGPDLIKIYKDEVYKFYYHLLIEQGEIANDRERYKLFVKDLRKLYDVGGDKYADNVFDFFRENYKIRSAMQEELNVLNSKRNRK